MSYRYHTDDIELLFHILRCFTTRFIVQFQFVKDFLDNVLAAVRGIQLHFTIYVLSSPELKAQVTFSDQNLSVVCRYRRHCWRCRKLFTFSSSSPEPLGQFQPNLTQSILWWRGFKFLQMKGPVLFQGETITK